MEGKRAPRNRTIVLSESEINELSKKLISIDKKTTLSRITNKLILGDFFQAVENLPNNFVDLMIIDPPYNLNKSFNSNKFKKMNQKEYSGWFRNVLEKIIPLMKSTGTVYVCSDWQTSNIIAPILSEYLTIQNRITWEREKGRGAKKNWKNNSEDIWFCTVGKEYYFNVDAVKLKKRVIAPYRDEKGKPKDWSSSENGKFRLTHPSNLWTDISIPFWSMPENTDHPTQKPEKLMAKLILASSKPGDFVFDPFAGSGTSIVTAQKLNRKFGGIEIDKYYAALAIKRLLDAKKNPEIQGYRDGVFWERNSKF